jgi:hypothetical protein
MSSIRTPRSVEGIPFGIGRLVGRRPARADTVPIVAERSLDPDAASPSEGTSVRRPFLRDMANTEDDDRDGTDGSEAVFAVVMIALSLLILFVVRRSEKAS